MNAAALYVVALIDLYRPLRAERCLVWKKDTKTLILITRYLEDWME
jgi:hypothetical protein